uniref:Secreted protein n=1 Tax=Panagrellus redivivus TaxID=6233 RepID=A0A7E4VRG5_PANRE
MIVIVFLAMATRTSLRTHHLCKCFLSRSQLSLAPATLEEEEGEKPVGRTCDGWVTFTFRTPRCPFMSLPGRDGAMNPVRRGSRTWDATFLADKITKSGCMPNKEDGLKKSC